MSCYHSQYIVIILRRDSLFIYLVGQRPNYSLTDVCMESWYHFFNIMTSIFLGFAL